MATGNVKWFNHEKGYGFIIQYDEDSEIFVHRTELNQEIRISEGDRVEFEIGNGPKGLIAQKVRLLEEAPPETRLAASGLFD